jgi:hypothetical protein
VTDERIERIRERAHRIWEEEGCPEGRDTEHWERAAREIDAEAAELKSTADRMGGGQGLTSGLRGGGTTPGGAPGASAASIGTSGGSTAARATGSAKTRTGTGKGSRSGS